jgi:integrase
MKLTETAVAATTLDPDRSEAIIFDEDIPGFGLRLRAGGARTWIFQYKLGSKHRRMTLGKYPALKSAGARKTAAKFYAEVRLGNDPAGARAEKQGRAAETFGAILKTYLTRRRGTIRASSYGQIERHLDLNLRPLHGLNLASLDRRAVATQLARITGENGPVHANRVRASLSKFLNWCCGEGLIETNAAAFTNQNPEKPRDRVLIDSELATIWKALLDGDYGDILKLLILTGQRREEIARLQWPEINFERDVIALPGARTKNHRAHFVPITSAVRCILEARRNNGRALVFGVGQGAFGGWTRCKAQLDAAAKVAPWVVHDIRRSVATGMAEIGVQPHVIEAVLNHVSGSKAGPAGIYNKSTYETEKANALQRWAAHVAAIIEGKDSNVTPRGGVS